MARVRAVNNTDVMNMSTSPKMATTTLRKATLMLEVPALFMRRVSCRDRSPLGQDLHPSFTGFGTLAAAVTPVRLAGGTGQSTTMTMLNNQVPASIRFKTSVASAQR